MPLERIFRKIMERKMTRVERTCFHIKPGAKPIAFVLAAENLTHGTGQGLAQLVGVLGPSDSSTSRQARFSGTITE